MEQSGDGVRQSAGRDATLEHRARYAAVRSRTLALAAPLSAEDQLVQSMPDTSPTKWHLAHTTWFFDALVLPRLAAGRALRSEWSYLWNSYYESLGARQPRALRGLLSRPRLEEVHAYRDAIDELIMGALDAGVDGDSWGLIELGLEHEQQHQELLLTDIKHAFASSPLHPSYGAPEPPPAQTPPLTWHSFDAGVSMLGHDGAGFSFDNERPRHRVFLESFDLASRLITAGEFIEFIDAGGYRTPLAWLADGWQAVAAGGWSAPLYWERRDGAYWHATLGGMRRVRPDDPVCHVSYYEADAFARWYGARLPTEAEWEHVAAPLPVRGNFMEGGRYQPLPAPAALGVAQLFGDAWEWTASAYLPYPGFESEPGAIGEYNGKFMCNQMVLRGGSCLTPAGHLRASYRNFFPPGARWQLTGIRLARSHR